MRPGISHTPTTPQRGASQDATSPGPTPKNKSPKRKARAGEEDTGVGWPHNINNYNNSNRPLSEAELQQPIWTALTSPLNARLVSRTRPEGFGLSFVNDADVVGAAYRERRKGRQYQGLSRIHMTSQDKYLLLSGNPESQPVELSYSFLTPECKQAGNTKNMLGESC